ncbi:uncharacterized protein LY89DRAFT_690485 [Mollisia scopiformis]|uniref:Uncharacterized protein n=1 Tax=Mollisia scopiformis TaxID=149040 RepID=A0A132BCC2_MOLSC|nr:uncharacterized protein LY89DRAFT_690485 [Mollisia scopiformis]KUJ09504.1 hypothetical protein LY89DRAFT_690485 [Mollisia scopiformis]
MDTDHISLSQASSLSANVSTPFFIEKPAFALFLYLHVLVFFKRSYYFRTIRARVLACSRSSDCC